MHRCRGVRRCGAGRCGHRAAEEPRARGLRHQHRIAPGEGGLQADGAKVTREYYFNDAGSQIERFARTLREVANGRPVPEDGYNGEYIDEIAAAVVAARPDVLALPDDEQAEVFRREGVELMFA